VTSFTKISAIFFYLLLVREIERERERERERRGEGDIYEITASDSI